MYYIPTTVMSVKDLVAVVLVRFSSPILHSVMAKYSLGGLTALLVTVVTHTSFKVFVTLGSGILLTEVFPATVTSASDKIVTVNTKIFIISTLTVAIAETTKTL